MSGQKADVCSGGVWGEGEAWESGQRMVVVSSEGRFPIFQRGSPIFHNFSEGSGSHFRENGKPPPIQEYGQYLCLFHFCTESFKL